MGVSDVKLLNIARKMVTPLTYSDNIKDVCERFRKSAVLTKRVFHLVTVHHSSAAFKRCSEVEKDLLQHMHNHYASAVTYSRLRQHYPRVLAETPAIALASADTPGQTVDTSLLPDTLTIQGVVYRYVALWPSTSTSSTTLDNFTSSIVNASKPSTNSPPQPLSP